MRPLLLTAALAALVLSSACGDRESPPKSDKEPATSHEGPHGGHLLPLGSVGQLEVEQDEAAKTMTIWILGKDGKTPMPIAKAPELKLSTADGPKVLKSEAVDLARAREDGKSSVYRVTGEELKEHDLDGRISVEVDGKVYNPTLVHKH